MWNFFIILQSSVKTTPASASKPNLQFSEGSFLENEKRQSSIEKKTTYDQTKSLPENPFKLKTSPKKSFNQNVRNIVPAGYESDNTDSDYDYDYDGFDLNY